jgi:hypothetical protein
LNFYAAVESLIARSKLCLFLRRYLKRDAWVTMSPCDLHFQPQLPAEAESVDYDSADSAVSDLDDEEEEEDVFEGTTANSKAPDRENTEHSNPSSFSWCIMRLAVMRLVQHQLQDFLSVAGIEIQGEDVRTLFPWY